MAERLIGWQRPPILSLPDSHSLDAGDEALEFCAAAGMVYDDWQSWCLRNGCATRERGLWAADEIGILVSRQNGKNEIVVGAEVAWLGHFHEELIIHTAHKFNASREHFRKVKRVFERNDWLMRMVKSNGFRTTTGQESIELRPTPAQIIASDLVIPSKEPRLVFLARSKGSGRSFTCDKLVYDEAMELTDEEVGDSLPTLSAVPNSQVWYLASAGFPWSTALARVRNRGLNGTDPSLLWLEWSIEPHNEFCGPGCSEHDEVSEVASWAKANPALGGRLSIEKTRKEFIKMGPVQFARERCGVGDWPVDEMSWSVIPEAAWNACAWPGTAQAKNAS